MNDIHLVGPPGYEYHTDGPWFVCFDWGRRRPQAWIMWTFESAIMRFWQFDGDTVPRRRVMVDARGVTVLGIAHTDDGPKMCGVRTAMEATLKLTGDYTHENALEVMAMVEAVRQMDGQPL
jgi:hypothetical protein